MYYYMSHFVGSFELDWFKGVSRPLCGADRGFGGCVVK